MDLHLFNLKLQDTSSKGDKMHCMKIVSSLRNLGLKESSSFRRQNCGYPIALFCCIIGFMNEADIN